MIKRSIILFPNFKNIDTIEKIREKYDPLYNCIRPHITIVFPFESDISTKELKNHIEDSLKGIGSFKLKLKGITGTSDNYLFLNVKKGNDEIIEMHDKLYSGILEKYLYNRISYIPHITVGKLNDNELFENALNDLENLSDEFETIIDEIYVEQIDENENSIIEFIVKL